MTSSPSTWTRKARQFWEQRQRRAPQGSLTGYLLDESPPSIGARRFEGEWAQCKAWLGAMPGPKERCLDLGCGTGAWLEALAREFKHAEGWDYAPAMVQASRRRLKARGIRNASLQVGQITRRKGKAAFDFIFVGGVLMYCPDAELPALLRSLARLLRPGGLLLLRESTCQGETWLREKSPLRPGLLAVPAGGAEDYVAIYRSEATLRSALAAAGLETIQVSPNRHYKFSDLCEDWLRRLDALSGGRIRSRPARAEAAARAIYALRFLLCYPEYFVRQGLGIFPWKLENKWFLAKALIQVK